MSEWRIETSIPPETRAERRERIAVRLVASMCVDPDASWESLIRVAMTGAEMLMAELDKAAANDAKEEGK